MGKLTIQGHAEREVRKDTMHLAFNISCRADTSANAFRLIDEECERFLGTMKDLGIAPSDLRFAREENCQHCRDDRAWATAERRLALDVPFDMHFLNHLQQLLEERDFAIDFHCSCSYRNDKAVLSELLREAIQDSRKKAELIADATGQKVTGIDSVKYGSDIDCLDDEDSTRVMFRTVPAGGIRLSDDLIAETDTIAEDIQVTWLIE